jgi:hypothetical protein
MANPPPSDTLPFNADANSYTQHRLSHATPDHLHITTRRCFIGPIPKGWLNSHRKEWYKHHLHINYSSRTATFSASDNVSHQRSATALDGQRAISFPQSEDLSEEAEESHDEEEEEEEEGTPLATPAVPVPSISNVDGDRSQYTRTILNDGDIIDEAIPLSEAEAEASTPKVVGPSRNGGLLSPPAHTSRKAGTRMSKRGFGSPEDDAKSKGSVYVDAPEFPISSSPELQKPARTSTVSSQNGALSSTGSDLGGDDTSTSPLITHAAKTGAEEEAGSVNEQGPDTALHKLESSPTDGVEENGESLIPRGRKSGHVNFDFPEESRRAQFKSRVNQLELKRPLRRVLRRRTEMEGRIVKMERMLVRIDITKEQKLPDDYDENSGEGVITQTLEKWREFMVVCRQASKAEGSDFVLQIYKTRVSPFFHFKKKVVCFDATLMLESYILFLLVPLDRRC